MPLDACGCGCRQLFPESDKEKPEVAAAYGLHKTASSQGRIGRAARKSGSGGGPARGSGDLLPAARGPTGPLWRPLLAGRLRLCTTGRSNSTHRARGPDDRGAASDRFPPRRSKPAAAAIEQPARRATDENQFQSSPAGEEPPCSATTPVRSRRRRRCFVRPPPHLAAHSAASNARTHASMSAPLLLLASSSALIVIESTLPSPPLDCAVKVAEEGAVSSIYART